jgi:hypothetical protein
LPGIPASKPKENIMAKLPVQTDKFGQPVKLVIESANGEPLRIATYVANLTKSQDLAAWQGNADGLKLWLADHVRDFILNADVRIYGFSPDCNPVPATIS